MTATFPQNRAEKKRCRSVLKILLPILWFTVVFLACIDSAHANFSNRSPYHIIISSPDDLNYLVHMGADIDRVSGHMVYAYLSPFERDLLQSMLFPITSVPDLEKTAHLLYHGKRIKADEPALYYPTYDQLTTMLADFALSYPVLCHVSSIGQSVQGRDLWAVTISDNAEDREAEPVVSLVSTLHGNEPVGTVLLVELIRYLLENYNTDPRIQSLVDNHDIRIVPLANPDGYEAGSRYNASGLDLNRNFPDPSEQSDDRFDSDEGRAPETLALMAWIMDRPAAVSANFHTGSQLVNYPLDYTLTPSPDDALFQHMSLAYASNNPTIPGSSYESGIVRGAVWYIITGGLQDWAYLGSSELHVTVELSTIKYPDPSELNTHWDNNRESLLAYLETSDTGIGGKILDADTGEPLTAWIRITGNSHYVFTDPQTGYYMRVLLPGNYSVTAGADGYLPKTVEDVSATGDSVSACDFLLDRGNDPTNVAPIVSNWPKRNDMTGIADETSNGGGCFIGVSL
ncbi:MAG: M14 family zinc carboxypeptidase [Desulfobacteraceae bacterium]|jgi:hypothetical protein